MPDGRLFLELYRLSWGIAALVRLIELQSTWELKEHVDWVKAGGASRVPPTLFAFVYFLNPQSLCQHGVWRTEMLGN